MPQQYSLAHLTVLGCAPPEMIYIAARAGYDFVSVRSIFMGLPGEANYGLSDNPEMLRQTRRALASTGVKLHDIELARICDEVDPRRYLPALEIAAELGARAVLSSIWTPRREYAIEQFGLLSGRCIGQYRCRYPDRRCDHLGLLQAVDRRAV